MLRTRRLEIAILLIPALISLLIWQCRGETEVHPARLSSIDQIVGFAPAEPSEAGAFRWASATARLALPGNSLPGVLMLRGAVAPGADLQIIVGQGTPIQFPPANVAPQLRRYSLLLAVTPDEIGWADLQIRADPPGRTDGRDLSLALNEVRVIPVKHGLGLPPLFAWAILSFIPILLALILKLAGMPGRAAVRIACIASLILIGIWAAQPQATYGLFLDLRAFLSEPQIWRWWFTSFIAGLLAWPISARLLGGLPLAGYPLAKILGLLLVTWLTWLAAIIGVIPFSQSSVITASTLIAILAWLAPGMGRWYIKKSQRATRSLLALPAIHIEGILAYEILFLAGLFVGIWARWHGAVGPAVFGTEKPMELAILNALLRYGYFPPPDPWLAGFTLNYYYLGYVSIAALALITNTPSASAFNLGMALLLALTSVGVAYIGHSLVALSSGPARPTKRADRAGVGVLALIACLILGSQSSSLQLLVGSHLIRVLDTEQLVSAVAQRLTGATLIRLSYATPPSAYEPPFDTIIPASDISFDWYGISRTLYDDVRLPDGSIDRRYAITETPSFSFYLGDLHPHVIAIPVNLLALAIALSLIARPNRDISRLIIAGIIIGCIYCINPWDAPTYALLNAGALLLGIRRSVPHATWPSYLIRLALLGGSSLGVALPFMLTFRSPSAPVTGSIASLPIINRLASTFSITSHHTQIHSFLISFGLFILMTTMLIIPSSTRPRWGMISIASSLILGPLIGFPLLFLIPLTLLLTIGAWADSCTSGEAIARWVAAVGCLVLIVPEIIYIRDHLEGMNSRINTIFKAYYQGWILLSVVAAYATWKCWKRAPGRWMNLIWVPVAGLLLMGALVYPVGLFLWAEPWGASERTIDGLAGLRREQPDQIAAAHWLAEHMAPDDVLLSATCQQCEQAIVSRPAMLSGVQSVLGWVDGHEELWRRGDPVAQAAIADREYDIPAIYTASDPATARALLSRYGVSYIYFGPIEYQLYAERDATFVHSLPRVFRQGNISIYRVER